MINSILQSQLREQAGSNSFNRFDYQVHWIVYHMINEYKNNAPFLIFCEYHDDMTKSNDIENPECIEFYQIKTSETYKKWSMEKLCRTTKKANGNIKHSFLGFVFYNFLTFNSECSKCHFVSNIDCDETIGTWQSIIEDGKNLKEENLQLYNDIKDMLRKEYSILEETLFTEIYDRFIHNTYIYYGNLSLNNYEKVLAGEFFQMLDTEDIYTSNSNKILRDIIEEVRKKSKKKITTPISYHKLVEFKGISSDIFNRLKEQVNSIQKKSNIYNDIESLLIQYNFSIPRRKLLIRKLTKHNSRMLDIINSLYQDNIIEIKATIDSILEENYINIDDITMLKEKLISECKDLVNASEDIDEILVEALLYEKLVS